MGAIFIGIGFILLANNFGYLPVFAWNILINFWPITLIAIGLEIISKDNIFLRIFINLFMIVLVGFIMIEVFMIFRPDFRYWMEIYYPQVPYLKNLFIPQNRFYPGMFMQRTITF